MIDSIKNIIKTKYFLIVLSLFLATRIYNVRQIPNNYYINNENINKLGSTFQIGGDGEHFALIAYNISKQFSYSEFGTKPTESASWRPPIWPLVLSFLFVITSNLKVILLLKSFLMFILIYLVIIKTKLPFNLRKILILLIVLEPQFFKYNNTLLSEDLSATFLLISTIYVLENLIYKSKPRLHQYALLGISILTHPITIFYNGLILLTLLILEVKESYIKNLSLGLILFLLIFFSWPIRNQIQFNRGLFITSSQGATFSKGWNDSVIYLFTNTQGDLANEGLNIKYLPENKKYLIENSSILNLKEAYTLCTIEFIKSSSISNLMKIALIKLKSNFNPLPETSKKGMVEILGSSLRLFYLIVFIYFLFKFSKNDIFNSFVIILGYVYISQALMSIAFYTGLRFNVSYSLIQLVSCVSLLYYNFISFKPKTQELS
jgi:hypothetical protein